MGTGGRGHRGHPGKGETPWPSWGGGPEGTPGTTPPVHRRLTDANGKESWVTNNTYWKLRLDPGFAHLDSAVLW